jgi:Domain of unknown function (DUF4440)
MLLSIAAACGASPPKPTPTIVLAGRAAPDGAHTVWVIGFVQQAKLGAIVQAGDVPVTCADQGTWPAGLLGRPIVVAGTLSTRTHPALLVGPSGEHSAGVEGDELILSPGTPPPAQTDDGLLAAERAVFDSLAHRDGKTLASQIAPEFVLHVASKPDTDRQTFLSEATATKGEILAVEGADLVTHRAGDTGIVRGTQVTRVRVAGQVVEDRSNFLDVFVRRDGRWIITTALSSVTTAVPDASAPEPTPAPVPAPINEREAAAASRAFLELVSDARPKIQRCYERALKAGTASHNQPVTRQARSCDRQAATTAVVEPS